MSLFLFTFPSYRFDNFFKIKSGKILAQVQKKIIYL